MAVNEGHTQLVCVEGLLPGNVIAKQGCFFYAHEPVIWYCKFLENTSKRMPEEEHG
jgi:hypothetical protein